MKLDRLDTRILAVLQEDGRLPLQEVGEIVGLSASQCGRRLRRLEEAGLVSGYAALLDPVAFGFDVTAFVTVTLAQHGEAPAARFHRAIERLPNILECWAVTGEGDYLLRVVATNLKSFSDVLMHDLLALPEVANVKSNIALDRIKQTTALPLSTT
tara:strand:- start:791 stop:1258 length:468 start_codon:yes stop_codon:yes gene_type:complete